MSEKQITNSSIARMAGNIAAGLCSETTLNPDDALLQRIAETSVRLAWLIAREVERKVQ